MGAAPGRCMREECCIHERMFLCCRRAAVGSCLPVGVPCGEVDVNSFLAWLDTLRDYRALMAIDARLERLSRGNFGHCRSLSLGLWEMKVDVGPGYRLYFSRVGRRIILLLCGGDKGAQRQDIELARIYLNDWRLLCKYL